MHTITPDHFDAADAETYHIRSTVSAVRCPDGASLTDDNGDVTATYAGPCYVIEGDDGNHRIASAYVFDALYDTPDDYDAGDQGEGDPNDETTPPAVPSPTTTPPAKTTTRNAAKATTRGRRR